MLCYLLGIPSSPEKHISHNEITAACNCAFWWYWHTQTEGILEAGTEISLEIWKSLIVFFISFACSVLIVYFWSVHLHEPSSIWSKEINLSFIAASNCLPLSSLGSAFCPSLCAVWARYAVTPNYWTFFLCSWTAGINIWIFSIWSAFLHFSQNEPILLLVAKFTLSVYI